MHINSPIPDSPHQTVVSRSQKVKCFTFRKQLVVGFTIHSVSQ